MLAWYEKLLPQFIGVPLLVCYIVAYSILYRRELLRCQFYCFGQCEGLILWN